MTIKITDEGIKEYGEMLEKQRTIFKEMTERKRRKLPIKEEQILMVEHRPVITLGKHAKEANVLFDAQTLASRGVAIFHIERGGDVTYHAPGQLVVYPLIDMEAHSLGVKDYVFLLEEVVIRTLRDFGIEGERVNGASGVWLEAGTENERKICALGVKCSRYITMHGLALNVNTDMSGFSLINPCGFIDKGVTSMERESGQMVDIEEVKQKIANNFKQLLGYGE